MWGFALLLMGSQENGAHTAVCIFPPVKAPPAHASTQGTRWGLRRPVLSILGCCLVAL